MLCTVTAWKIISIGVQRISAVTGPSFIIILILKVVMVDIKIDINKQVLIDLPFSRYWVLNTSDKLFYNNESKYIYLKRVSYLTTDSQPLAWSQMELHATKSL